MIMNLMNCETKVNSSSLKNKKIKKIKGGRYYLPIPKWN
jgi:hypothetical protein